MTRRSVTLQGWMSQLGQAAPTPLLLGPAPGQGQPLLPGLLWHCPGGHTSCRTSTCRTVPLFLAKDCSEPSHCLPQLCSSAPGQLLSRDQVCLSQAKCILCSDRLSFLSSSCPKKRLSCEVSKSDFFLLPFTLTPATRLQQPEPTFLAHLCQNKLNWKIIH